MIKLYINEDIFKSTADAIVNTVNVKGVMGKGLALSFKNKYPKMYQEYRKRCLNAEIKVGQLDIHKANDGRTIINFPTKEHWKNKSDTKYIIDGFNHLRKIYKTLEISSIAFPPLGCGNGGLEWENVKPLMKYYLDPLELDVEIYVSSELEYQSNETIDADNLTPYFSTK